MTREEVRKFFDDAAADWDASLVVNEKKVHQILDAAGVQEDSVILDVACGTGVLFPYYLERKAAHITGVDLSPKMIHIARSKFSDSHLELICGDIELLPVSRLYDCCVVYNAFPHFENPQRLIQHLAQWIRPGGRITIAHGMSLAALKKHHAGRAEHVSREMLKVSELAELLVPWFQVTLAISDEEKYIVTGIRH